MFKVIKNKCTSFICTLAFVTQFAAPAALAVEAAPLKISRLGDIEMTCNALSQEAMLMHEIVSTTELIKDDAEMTGKGISAIGALGSFLVGTVTGGVGFAAAGYILKEATGEEGKEADQIQDIAKQRRSLMMGIFNAKGCNGPIEHVMQDPAPSESLLALANIEPAAGHDPEEPDYND